MPITVECPECYRQVSLPDESAGTTYQCSHCRTVIEIPGSSPKDARKGYGVERRTRTCPGCARRLAPEAVVCIECGYDFRSGKRIRKRSGDARSWVYGVPALGWYTRYAILQDRKGDWFLVIRSYFLFLPMSARQYDLALYEAACTDFRSAGRGRSYREWYSVALQGRRGRVVLYRGGRQVVFKWLVDALHQVAGLEIKRI
jgi:hypothetical protein